MCMYGVMRGMKYRVCMLVVAISAALRKEDSLHFFSFEVLLFFAFQKSGLGRKVQETM